MEISIMATFALQQKFSDLLKIVLRFVGYWHRKKYLNSLHAGVKANNAFLSKNGHKSSQI